jgi:flagellar biosynthetic protein FlhB
MINKNFNIIHINKNNFKDSLNHKEHLFAYKLQYFAKDGPGGEKTEVPTGKKLTDARSEGQVAKSHELIMASSLLGLFLTLKIFLGYIGEHLLEAFQLFYNSITKITKEDFSAVTGSFLLRETIILIIQTVLPILVIAFIVSFTVNVALVKWQITGKPLKPKLSNINPLKGFGRLFAKDKLIQLLKETLKIAAIIYIVNDTLKNERTSILQLYDME